MKSILKKYNIAETAASTLISLVMGLLVGSIVLSVAGYSPLSAYSVILSKTIGDFGQVVGYATPLVFTGLAVAIPYSVGIFNLGAEGQIIAGSFAAALAGTYFTGLPRLMHIPLTLLCAGLAGMLVSALIATLKLRFNASETVVAIMFNSIILLLAEYAVNYPLRDPTDAPKTVAILESAQLGKANPTDSYSSAIYLAAVCAVLAWLFLNKTVLGFEAKSAGFNPFASRYKGVNIAAMSLLGMALGGMFAGIGGAGEVMGLQHCYYHGHVANMGYTGVGVALVARKNPLAVIPSAFLFAAIRTGGMTLDRLTNIPSYFIWVLQGTIIIFLAVPEISIQIKNMLVKIPQLARGKRARGGTAHG